MSLALFIGLAHLGMMIIFATNLVYLRRRRPANLPEPAPKVSILIPARNESPNLRRLLESLRRQTYVNAEYIVYNDQSTDDTLQILQAFEDDRLIVIDGTELPEGWVGKVHALFQASKRASGELYLFLDADTELADPESLERLVQWFEGLPPDSVLTGLSRYAGGGLLLVSLVAHAALATLPWSLVRAIPISTLGALNGQCWMIRSQTYRSLEPHRHVASEVLEDVLIGRYLKKNGITPVLVDIQRELTVYMYDGLGAAWRGFRKNVYLLMGNNFLGFLALFTVYSILFVLPPFVSPWLLLAVSGNKFLTDRTCHFSYLISLLAPLSYFLGSTLQLDSAWHHLTRRVTWKDRSIQDH